MNILTKRLAEALDNLVSNTDETEFHKQAIALLGEYVELEKTPRDHFHLVFAEVIYRGKNSDVRGTRVNVFTKAPDMQFPARRLSHIQNSCAHQAKMDLQNPKYFDVQAVNILGMYYLGEFTDVEFYAGIQAVTEVDPATIEAATDGKVTPIKQPD